jgi:hypothetical protein
MLLLGVFDESHEFGSEEVVGRLLQAALPHGSGGFNKIS